MPNEWEFSICFPSCYDSGVTSGTSNFSASTNQYLNCHFYPNNTAGQGVVKMEITTNLTARDTSSMDRYCRRTNKSRNLLSVKY